MKIGDFRADVTDKAEIHKIDYWQLSIVYSRKCLKIPSQMRIIHSKNLRFFIVSFFIVRSYASLCLFSDFKFVFHFSSVGALPLQPHDGLCPGPAKG